MGEYVTKVYDVMFVVVTNDHHVLPSSQQFVDAVRDALPKEWFASVDERGKVEASEDGWGVSSMFTMTGDDDE